MRLPIILIGLSTILLSGCPRKSDKIYHQNFKNISGSEIHIIVISDVTFQEDDTLVIVANEIKTRRIFPTDPDADVNEAIRQNIHDLDYLSDTIKLIMENKIKKQWTGPICHYGDSINSPFNYDSWDFKRLNPDDSKNVIGEITFTITDDDLN